MKLIFLYLFSMILGGAIALISSVLTIKEIFKKNYMIIEFDDVDIKMKEKEQVKKEDEN